MIITRQNVCRFERLVSKLFPTNGIPQRIFIENTENGSRMIATGKEHSIVMTVPGSNENVSFAIHWQAVKEIMARKVGLVEFNVSNGSATVTWENNGIPQQKAIDVVDRDMNSLPALPTRLEEITPRILDAIVSGSRCVDPENTRYSLGSLCLRAQTSQVISTDGRQAFIQDGYVFPWEDDVLCPVSKIFASKELRESIRSVKIGTDKEYLVFEVDNVLFWLKTVDGKYPRLDQFHRNIGHFTWLNLDNAEAAFVAGRLDHLPGAKDNFSPVYLELDENIAVRGHDIVQETAVEIRMPKSRVEGKGTSASLNRKFLKNAIELGARRIGIDPDERSPLVCYGEQMMFVIMPLDGEEPKAKSVTMLQTDNTPVVMPTVAPKELEPLIESPPETKPKASRTRPMDTQAIDNVPLESHGDRAKPGSRSEALAEAEELYGILKDAANRAKNLVRQIKGTRQHERELLRREQEIDKRHQRLMEAATLIGKV